MQNFAPHIFKRCAATAIALVAAVANIALQSGPMVLCVESDGHATIERVCDGSQDFTRDSHMPLVPSAYRSDGGPGHAACTDISLGTGAFNRQQQSLEHGRPQIGYPVPARVEFSGVHDLGPATALNYTRPPRSLRPASSTGLVLLI